MNETLENQLTLSRSLLGDAAAQNDIGQAKFALGMLVGAVSSLLPEDEAQTVTRVGMDIFQAGASVTMEQILDGADWIMRRGYYNLGL